MPFDPTQINLQRLGTLIADASSSVVFVVGAGLSAAAGIPLWTELNRRLVRVVEAHYKKIKAFDAKTLQSVIEDLQRVRDPWIFGDEVRRHLPRPEYEKAIRANLNGSNPPETYRLLWKLNPAGLISLNLDPFARLTHSGDEQDTSTALNSSNYELFLLRKRPFLFQPHGELKDPDSWVLGMESRNRLLRNWRYKRFIQMLLQNKRLVFCGVRPDDIAIGTLLLEDFREFATGLEHFWILDRPTREDDYFARNNNMLLVEYDSTPNHPEVPEILEFLANFTPRPLTTHAVYDGPAIPPEELPTEDQLIREPAQSIRARLNAALKYISDKEKEHEVRLAKIRDFYAAYARAISIAWTVDAGKNSQLWGTTIERLVGDGAFGTVYRAVDNADGRKHAVKILHQRVSNSADFLEAFQRGTEALRILTQKNMPGVVRFHYGFDVPACIFMEYVEGVDFQGAIEGRRFVTDLATSLLVVGTVAEIVNRGHNADRQILHRDLKPANIMIRSSVRSSRTNVDAEDIVVLDFDLSWYEGAAGKSVMSGARLHNYIAPEQLGTRRGSVSSRVPAVDVFGAGMLLYFAVTKTEPSLGVQNSASFVADTARMVREQWSPALRFVPSFLSNLIRESTYTEQSLRINMAALISGVHFVREAVSNPDNLTPDAAILEIEAILQTRGWSSSDALALSNMGKRRLVLDSSQLEISTSTHGGAAKVDFVLTFSDTGAANRRGLDVRLTRTVVESAAILSKGDLIAVDVGSVAQGHVQMNGNVNRGELAIGEIAEIADRVSRAAAHLQRVYL